MIFEVTSVNAFTEGALKGNPAGVCLLERFPSDAAMLGVAKQMGHAETAFLVWSGQNHFDLRWFTPKTEVPLCGHATLAAAHYLREMKAASGPVRFSTKSGELTARYEGDTIILDLPNEAGHAFDAKRIAKCIDVPATEWLRNKGSIVAVVADMKTLQRCKPDLDTIADLDSEDLLVTTKGEGEFDYTYRCFAPQVGINEDQVTGSANCILAPYWAEKLGKESFRALQASPNGGALSVRLAGTRVEVGGKAVSTGTTRISLKEAA